MYRRSNNIKHFVDVNSVSELHKVSNRPSKLTIGANVSLTDMMKILQSVAADKPEFVYCLELAKHIDLIATIPVRNVSAATIYFVFAFPLLILQNQSEFIKLDYKSVTFYHFRLEQLLAILALNISTTNFHRIFSYYWKRLAPN